MSRLRKIKAAEELSISSPNEVAEDTKDAQILIERIDEASNNLKDTYYILFDNLNALFDAYPDVYNQLKMLVKLPDNSKAEEIMTFYNDMKAALEHFKDAQYLSSYIEQNPAPTKNEE